MWGGPNKGIDPTSHVVGYHVSHRARGDLGDITTARGTEMYLALWTRLFMTLPNPMFSIKVVR